MNRNVIFRFITGYILGGSFFLLAIPGIIYAVFYFSEPVFPFHIFYSENVRIVVSILFIIPGIVFMVWSNAVLFIIGKGGPAEGFGVEISPKTRFLVIKGPYRYTRNPMVFGAYMMYISWAFFINSYISLVLVILFFPVIILYLKQSEENRLVKDFGEAYLIYRNRVSLLIPLPPKK